MSRLLKNDRNRFMLSRILKVNSSVIVPCLTCLFLAPASEMAHCSENPIFEKSNAFSVSDLMVAFGQNQILNLDDSANNNELCSLPVDQRGSVYAKPEGDERGYDRHEILNGCETHGFLSDEWRGILTSPLLLMVMAYLGFVFGDKMQSWKIGKQCSKREREFQKKYPNYSRSAAERP